MSRILIFLGALAVSLALSTEARAEDWSQFIDNNPKPMPVARTQAAKQPTPARTAKAPAAKPKAIAKARKAKGRK